MQKEREYWLTTEDNPFDFFTQTDRWLNYDCQMGYNTCGKIAKTSRYSHNLSPMERTMAINDACQDIVKNPATNFVLSRNGQKIFFYRLITKDSERAWN